MIGVVCASVAAVVAAAMAIGIYVPISLEGVGLFAIACSVVGLCIALLRVSSEETEFDELPTLISN